MQDGDLIKFGHKDYLCAAAINFYSMFMELSGSKIHPSIHCEFNGFCALICSVH